MKMGTLTLDWPTLRALPDLNALYASDWLSQLALVCVAQDNETPTWILCALYEAIPELEPVIAGNTNIDGPLVWQICQDHPGIALANPTIALSILEKPESGTYLFTTLPRMQEMIRQAETDWPAWGGERE